MVLLMKILTFSDVDRWEDLDVLVDLYRPEIVALGGDLTFDGGAPFHWIDDLRIPRGNDFEIFRRRRVDGFYSFLKYHAGSPRFSWSGETMTMSLKIHTQRRK